MSASEANTNAVRNRAKEASLQRALSTTIETAPLAALATLLVATVFLDAAFDLRYWAPLGVLALTMLLGLVCGGSLTMPSRGPVALAVAAIWSYAAWSLLSASWADSAGLAWEGAGRNVLYASLLTIAVAGGPEARPRRWVGGGLIAGVVAVALITVGQLLLDGSGAFLAGRLDAPVGYRNGTAALFAFAVWPLITVAAPRGGRPPLRAAAFGACLVLLGLCFLTQSRGVLLGLVAGGIASLWLGPDRVRRSWLALGAIAAVAAASGPLLTAFAAFDSGRGSVTEAHIATSATALILLGGVGFVVSLFLAVLDNGLRLSGFAEVQARRLGVTGLALVVTVIAIGALISVGNPVDYARGKWDEFTSLESSTTSGATRLGSVGGQRYDLWRVALAEFRQNPVVGTGEGNYALGYFQQRRTDRNLDTAHSLPLGQLAETGIVGAGLFALFLGALYWAIGRARRAAVAERRWIAGLAAAGTTVLAQCVTDWLWLLPSLIGLALLALGLAARGAHPSKTATLGFRRRSASAWLSGIAGIALVGAIISMSCLYLSDLFVRTARVDAAHSPPHELDAARRAAALNPVSVPALYLQASALETEGDRDAARQKLIDALELEPRNFVTLGLLGDLEARAGRLAAAHNYYQRALDLNPLDIGLQKLVGETNSAERKRTS